MMLSSQTSSSDLTPKMGGAGGLDRLNYLERTPTVRPHLDPSLNHIIQDLSPPPVSCCDSNILRTLRGIDSSVASRSVDICICQFGSQGVLPKPRFLLVQLPDYYLEKEHDNSVCAFSLNTL